MGEVSLAPENLQIHAKVFARLCLTNHKPCRSIRILTQYGQDKIGRTHKGMSERKKLRCK